MKRKPKKKNPEKEVLKILNTHRIVPSKKHQFKKLNTKHGPLWIHPTKRILCYQKHHSNRKEDTFAEAYGTLETDETIRPLNHEEKEWLEKQRIPISEAAVTKPKKPPQEKKQKTPKVKKTSQNKKTPKKPKEEDTPEEKEEEEKEEEDNTPEEKEEEDNTPEDNSSEEEEDTPKDNSSEEEEDIEFNLTEW